MNPEDRRYSLRLQLTTGCQLRCGYCRPQGADSRGARALRSDELVRAAFLLSKAGVDRIRLTGGEPLLHEDVLWIVGCLAGIGDVREVTLTTNGHGLAIKARPLGLVGLTRVNVHIDSLDPGRYRKLCGGDLARPLDGLEAAVAAGLSPKVNVVVQRGLNDDEIPAFCRLGRELGVAVRFIEIMDTGIAPGFCSSRFVSGAEIGARLEALGASRVPRSGSAPAVEYRFPDGGVAGVIASESEPFCDSCDRLRLGADGVLRTCLYSGAGLDVAALLRAQTPEDDVVQHMRAHIRAKRSEHPGGPAPVQPGRGFSMASIGG